MASYNPYLRGQHNPLYNPAKTQPTGFWSLLISEDNLWIQNTVNV